LGTLPRPAVRRHLAIVHPLLIARFVTQTFLARPADGGSRWHVTVFRAGPLDPRNQHDTTEQSGKSRFSQHSLHATREHSSLAFAPWFLLSFTSSAAACRNHVGLALGYLMQYTPLDNKVYTMPFHIRDAATDVAVRRLAKLKGTTLTETIRQAVEREFTDLTAAPPLVDQVRPIQAAFQALKRCGGQPADKEFFDDLSGQL
jgi:antitoxin VapB